ncbi:hypothetical protein M8C17_01245 [Micromonospora sp. RHAY321]|uniref:hypothetical protein n=1 Tax=Micromonospora sp. RHAY321 TaxID=2944807 RepID=UPI00207C8AB1|nr:hypothetical protein [Micromonospora sp. RHAY321]MCO1593787.1 hypothetical protein [Micromonospora sp. RHAY321]
MLLTDVADIPAGVVVSVLTFAPGTQVTLGASEDMEMFCVITGAGWVDSSESGRQELHLGSRLAVPKGDTPTLGSTEGMMVVGVFGGWMMPE